MLRPQNRKFSIQVVSFLSLLTLSTGCGVVVGNIKPNDQKSSFAKIRDLSEIHTGWSKLSLSTESESLGSQDIPDATFQHSKTRAIVSLNSACRSLGSSTKEDGNEGTLTQEEQKKELRLLTDRLLAGMRMAERSENVIKIPRSGHVGLETSAQGEMQGQNVKMRSVVIKDENQHQVCTYDLLLIASPKHFESHTEDFEDYVKTLELPR